MVTRPRVHLFFVLILNAGENTVPKSAVVRAILITGNLKKKKYFYKFI